MGTPWVVKLGGSLARSPQLGLWLDALANQRVAVVPGGGPFADQVRIAQNHWRFDDRAAHRMAILSMAQYGTMLAALQPRLRPAHAPDAVRRLTAWGSSVWLPHPAMLPEKDISPSWAITSDSLAAWLAGRIGARRMLLIKSTELPGNPTPLGELSRAGIVDPCVAGFAAASGVEVWLTGAHAHASLAAGLTHPADYFTAATEFRSPSLV